MTPHLAPVSEHERQGSGVATTFIHYTKLGAGVGAFWVAIVTQAARSCPGVRPGPSIDAATSTSKPAIAGFLFGGSMDVPPCVVPGQPLNPCARQLYAWEVTGKGWLPGDWSNWRLAGRYLVSPDGDRISKNRLTGILWRERQRLNIEIRKPVCQGEVANFARRCREATARARGTASVQPERLP